MASTNASTFADIIAQTSENPVSLHGTSTVVTALLASSWSESRPVVFVTPDEAMARVIAEDLSAFSEAPDKVLWLPAPDSHPYAKISADRNTAADRQSGLFRLADPKTRPRIVVLSCLSLVRKTLPPETFKSLARPIRKNDTVDRDEFISYLSKLGFARGSIVEDIGSYAARGEILDVFVGQQNYPVRLEFFGDEIESIRLFDPSTQRTMRELEGIFVYPIRNTIVSRATSPRKAILEAADRANQPSKQTRELLELIESGEEFIGIDALLPAFHDDLVPTSNYFKNSDGFIFYEPTEIKQTLEDLWRDAESEYQVQRDANTIAFPPGDFFQLRAELGEIMQRSLRIDCHQLERQDSQQPETTKMYLHPSDHLGLAQSLDSRRKSASKSATAPLVGAINEWLTDQQKVVIACASRTRAARLEGILRENELDVLNKGSEKINFDQTQAGGRVTLHSKAISEGFALASEQIVLLSETDVFGQSRKVSQRQEAAAKRARAALTGSVGDFSQLSEGDLLVHQLHGVGQYVGLKKLELNGEIADFLHLEYVGGTLYLPVYRLGEVERYVGSEGQKPKLDKLGGVTFAKRKSKVAAHVQALAEELLQVYAQRAALPGFAFPKGDAMFADFEAAFAFEETPDQAQAIEKVISDMEKPSPMDRLVCGDVGYGKTEVALRALFKAAVGGKQAAFLAPTTVLVEQHFQTMQKRFADWPVTIARLSRFQTASQQKETVRKLAEGTIDIVVGTHRLLSKDVRFANLGLLVIDEEQRFGVAHKEKLKRARTQMDVLTLTATPIPRTLHMAMSGLRDLSIIATPPLDRRSIRTFISTPEESTLSEGIRRELQRGGQIFFVAPRIESSKGKMSLAGWAEFIRTLAPTAKVEFAHGQMKSNLLEATMVKFVGGDIDILVSTTIVESGLDIAKANTMFIIDANHFGVSQLYQLRGRIGRSKERAYCYLLVPPTESMGSDARKRLEVLQRHSELGAGFMIASHDLEIRGAGELLGAKQSGSIAAVGFDAYTQMLDEAIAELRGEEIIKTRDPEMNVSDPGYIPDDYVEDVGQRLSLYKRLSLASDVDEISLILDEMEDRYGSVPDETKRLSELMHLKSRARALKIQSIELSSYKVAFAFFPETPVKPENLAKFIQKSPKSISLSRDQRILISFASHEQENPIVSAQKWLQSLVETTV